MGLFLAVPAGVVALVLLVLAGNGYLWMLLFAAGMIYGLTEYRNRGQQWGQPVAVVCGAGALAISLGMIFYNQAGCAHKRMRNRVQNIRRQVLEVKNRSLGAYLASSYPDSKVLIIRRNPGSLESVRMDAFKDAAKGALTVAAVQTLSGNDQTEEQAAYPMEMMMFRQKQFLDILEKHPETDIVVSYAGLPDNLQSLAESDKDLWTLAEQGKVNLPKLVLVGGGLRGKVPEKIKQKQVIAMITRNPDFRPETLKKPEGSRKEIFQRRFVLITPDNISKTAKEHPELFPAKDFGETEK